MITITNYRFENIPDWEEFVNNLFIGLSHYKKKNPDFKFKIRYTKEGVELKVLRLNESVN